MRSLVVRASQRQGFISAGESIVDEFFSTVTSWFFDMCMISTRA